VRRQGIAVDLWLIAKVLGFLAVAGALAALGGTPAWRGLALVLFTGLCFSFNAPHPRDLFALAATLLPRGRGGHG